MIHLLGGWIGIHAAGIAREIGQCCARLELDINKLSFKFKDDPELHEPKTKKDSKQHSNNSKNQYKYKKQNTRSVLEQEEQEEPDCSFFCGRRDTFITYGNLLIPYIVFLSSHYLKSFTKRFIMFANIYSPLVLMLPSIGAIIRIVGNNSDDNDENDEMTDGDGEDWIIILEWFYFVCVSFVLMITLSMLILFASVIAFDFRRRYYLIVFLTRLIQPGRYSFEPEYMENVESGRLKHKPHLFPNDWLHNNDSIKLCKLETLDLTDATTIYNWSRLRAFFLDFGLRFLRREEAILSVCTIEMLVVCIFYFSMIYFDVVPIRIYEVLTVFLSAFGVFVPSFVSLRVAEQINHRLAQQRSILADKRLTLSHEMYHLDDITIDHVTSGKSNKNRKKNAKIMLENSTKASQMMTQVIKLLEFEKFRIRMLGYEINTTVTGVFAFVLGSVGFACARLLTASL